MFDIRKLAPASAPNLAQPDRPLSLTVTRAAPGGRASDEGVYRCENWTTFWSMTAFAARERGEYRVRRRRTASRRRKSARERLDQSWGWVREAIRGKGNGIRFLPLNGLDVALKFCTSDSLHKISLVIF